MWSGNLEFSTAEYPHRRLVPLNSTIAKSAFISCSFWHLFCLNVDSLIDFISPFCTCRPDWGPTIKLWGSVILHCISNNGHYAVIMIMHLYMSTNALSWVHARTMSRYFRTSGHSVEHIRNCAPSVRAHGNSPVEPCRRFDSEANVDLWATIFLAHKRDPQRLSSRLVFQLRTSTTAPLRRSPPPLRLLLLLAIDKQRDIFLLPACTTQHRRISVSGWRKWPVANLGAGNSFADQFNTVTLTRSRVSYHAIWSGLCVHNVPCTSG